MTNRELWQSIMDQTEREIQTGHYTITFSKYEVYQFPKQPLFLKVRTALFNFLKRNVGRLYRKLKITQFEMFIQKRSLS